MKKLLPICLLLLLFSGVVFGQTKEIDSLKGELLKSTLNDTTKIKIYMNLSDSYYSHDIDSLGHYADLALKLSELTDSFRLASALNDKGRFSLQKANMDSARYYFKKVINIGESKKDTILMANGYANYESTLIDNTDFAEKVELCLKAIRLLEDHKYELGESQYNLSVIYANSGYDDLAIDYLKFAIKNAEESNHDLLMSYALGNLLHYQIKNNEFDDAKSSLEKSSALCEKLSSPRICSYYYLRAGTFYDKLKKYNQAESAYNKALIFAKELNDTYDLMHTYISVGDHYILSGNTKEAISNFIEFEKIYQNQSVPDLGVLGYKSWAKAEKMAGNFSNSNNYLEKYIKINDSLNTEKNKTSIANADTKYQSEKKDREIAEQQLALADQKLAITESNSKTRTMTILIVSLLLGSILLWFSFSQRQKRMQQQLVSIEREQEVRTLESLMEGEEKERLRIAKELHDGVNGDLSAIKFKLVSLLETNNTVINEAVTMIDNSCEQVRTISHNLVPPSLRDFDLLEAVENYCNDMNAIHKPEITFQHLGDAIVLEKKQEANVFRIIQELVTNSIKHAEAKEVLVQLSNVENNLQLTVEDNGKGFDIANVQSDGIGMQNIRSRVAYLNGALDIKSDAKGTSFTINFKDKTKNA